MGDPLEGGFTFRACVGDLSHGIITFGEAGLIVLPFIPGVDNITCGFSTTLFDLYFDLSFMTNRSGIFLFLVNILRTDLSNTVVSHGWRLSFRFCS